MSIENLGYWVLGVADMNAWVTFARDIAGLQVAEPGAHGSVALRADDYRQRILLVPDATDDLLEAGWEFTTEQELEAYVTRLRAAGTHVEQASTEDARLRRVERLYLCDDPNGGFRHGFYFGPELASNHDPFRPRAGTGAGFETGRLGIGHFVAVARDYERSITFYRDVLRLRESDYVREQISPDKQIEATFFHTQTGRHHSLAISTSPGRKRISHIMLQYKSMDDVGLAYDRCVRAGITIVLGLGQHPNDRMFSFYATTPSGFAMELGYGGVVIDDAQWRVATYSHRSDWGHELFPRGNPAA